MTSRITARPPLHQLLSRRAAVVVAIITTLLTATLAWLFHGAFPQGNILFLYMPVIGAMAYVGGPWPGIVALVLSLATGWFFIISPPYSFAISVETGSVLAVFALVGALLVDGATRLRNAEMASYRFALLVETADDAIYSWSPDAVIETWNRGAERLYGYTAEEAVGRSATMLVPPDRLHEMSDIMARLRRGERVEHLETVRVTKDGRSIDVSLSFSPFQDARDRAIGTSVIARDISGQKRATRDRAELHEAEHIQRLAAEKTVDEVGRMLSVTTALADARTLREVTEAILAEGSRALNAQAGAIYALTPDEEGVETLGHRGYPEGLVKQRGRARLSDPYPVVHCITTGQAIYADAADALLRQYPRLQGRMHPHPGARAYLPLIASGRIIGVLAFVFRDVRAFDAGDRDFMQVLARQCALAVERARLYEREHHIASRLQYALLPGTFPAIRGIVIDATYRAGMEEADVGGDWYDAFLLPGDRVVLTVGDVAGRGLEAAMLMGETRHAVRSAAFAGHDPAKVLQVANGVVRSGPYPMVTAVVVMLDPLTLQCTYAAAGHPGPLFVTPTGIQTLDAGTLPLGIEESPPIAAASLRLLPGSLLVLYTDGLTEFDRDSVAGEAMLRRAVADQFARRVAKPAQAIVNQLLADRSARDDIAILTAFVEPGVGC